MRRTSEQIDGTTFRSYVCFQIAGQEVATFKRMLRGPRCLLEKVAPTGIATVDSAACDYDARGFARPRQIRWVRHETFGPAGARGEWFELEFPSRHGALVAYQNLLARFPEAVGIGEHMRRRAGGRK